jgi:hypothetical protein
MRFMGLLKADKQSEARLAARKDLLENMGKYMEEMTNVGVLLTSDGLRPSPLGARVRLSAGRVTVSNGPFNETKCPSIPCGMFDVDSMTEAVQWTTSFLKALGEGECEIRPL